MALFAFSPNEASFGAVSADNRLSVWNQKDQQQFVEKDHLLSKCTSIAWQNSKAKTPNSGLVALGMENGTISLWDLQRGVVSRKLGKDESLASVTDLVFSNDGQFLYSASSDKHVIEWDVETGAISNRMKGDKSGTSALAASKQFIAAGSLSIRLFDQDTRKSSKKFSGSHSAKISTLSFTPNGNFLASASSGVRVVNIYSVEKVELLVSVSLLHNPLRTLIGQSNDSLTLMVNCEQAFIETFRFKTNESDNISKASFQVADGAASILSSKFETASPHSHLVVATGDFSLPTLKTIRYADEEGNLTSWSEDSAAVAVSSSAVLGGDHHLLGPSDKSSRAAEADMLLPATKRPKVLDGEKELSIAERLEAMASALALPQLPRDVSKTPKGESLVAVLEQALQSRDDTLLEECLVVTDPMVVDSTVNRLTSSYVLPFLLLLSEKVERSPTRGLSLCAWMKAVLTKHASYLMSIPNLHLKLASLYQILDDRANVFPKLLSLNGRLELALSQLSPTDKVSDEVVSHTFYDESVEDALGDSDSE